jgi:hypothetical protein
LHSPLFPGTVSPTNDDSATVSSSDTSPDDDDSVDDGSSFERIFDDTYFQMNVLNHTPDVYDPTAPSEIATTSFGHHDGDFRAQTDDGSQASTTPHKHLLFNFSDLNRRVFLVDAGGTVYKAQGEGFLCVPATTDHSEYKEPYRYFRCYYTPDLPETIWSPSQSSTDVNSRGYSTHVPDVKASDDSFLRLPSKLRRTQDIHVPLITRNGKNYTQPLRQPTLLQRIPSLPKTVLQLTQP